MVLRLDVGSKAENFALKNWQGNEIRLSDLIGKHNILMIFYIGKHDKDAIKFLEKLKMDYPRIKELDTEVIVITPEIQSKARSTVESMQLPFEMVSDPELKIIKMYDVYNPVYNWAWPAAFIIDKNGVIQYSFRGASSPNTPPISYILSKLRQMHQGPQTGGRTEARA